LSSQSKGKTLLRIMQEREPDSNFTAETVCALLCAEVTTEKCVKEYGGCSWLALFTKRRFVEVST
jgi:hypothetical protein